MDYIDDLKQIKKRYGENMAHLCRELFPTLLDKPGLLLDILLKYFYPSKYLYEDLINLDKVSEFKNFIYSKRIINEEKNGIDLGTPQELMKRAGYILYECHSEEDIQKFRHYYAYGEELCTFKDNRLNRCFVFFAIKENVDDIKRENYKNPMRQDEYGTSVISIQFSRDNSHMLSIKNRYNHTVRDPDATYSNNLDNIITGLTESFSKYYGLKQKVIQGSFEIDGYTRDNNGKFYKYNYEVNGIYYCANNLVIKDGMVYDWEQEKYIIMDYFILDLVNKRILNIDKLTNEEIFAKELEDIMKIDIIKDSDTLEKEITIMCKYDKIIKIRLDKYGRIITYSNNKIKKVYDFLPYNKVLKEANMPNLNIIGSYAFTNKELTQFNIPNGVVSIGTSAFYNNSLTSIIIPDSVKLIASKAFADNCLKNVILSKSLISIGQSVFEDNEILSIDIPDSVLEIKDYAFSFNKLTNLILPDSVEIIGGYAFSNNKLRNVLLPKGIRKIDKYAFSNNNIESIVIPEGLEVISRGAFRNNAIKKLILPDSVYEIDVFAFADNLIEFIDLNHVIYIRRAAFIHNKLKNIEIPNTIKEINYSAFWENEISMVMIDEDTGISYYAFDDSTKVFKTDHRIKKLIR